MFRILAALLLPALLTAAGGWQRFRSGPFEVLTGAGPKPGREILLELEQLRFTLGFLLGQPDMEAVWGFRVVVFDSAQEARRYGAGQWRLGRDAWMLAAWPGGSLSIPEFTNILLEANTQRMPDDVESGLRSLLSTIRVERTRVMLGAPVPAGRRNLAWARMHLLTVNPKYSGRVRVLFANVQQGGDWHSAYGNAFETTPEAMDAEVERYLAAGSFPIRTISGAPISVRDFSPRDFGPGYVETALADLLEGEAARAAHQAVLDRRPGDPAALEGAGRYEEAVKAGSRSARCYLEYGKRLEQPVRARAAWTRAAELNPRWAEPYVLMAGVDTNETMKLQNLRKATELEPRNPEYWVMTAEAYAEAGRYRDAARTWGGAMRSAKSAEERERYYQARMKVEAQRTGVMSDARRNRIEERSLEHRRLRDEWADLMRRAREPDDPNDPEAVGSGADVVEWWDDPRPKGRAAGTLAKVDCIRGVARLVIEGYDGKTVQLVVRNPGEIVLTGGGERTLGCGPQNPPRSVTVEYVEEVDENLNTIGEVTLVEFR